MSDDEEEVLATEPATSPLLALRDSVKNQLGSTRTSLSETNTTSQKNLAERLRLSVSTAMR